MAMFDVSSLFGRVVVVVGHFGSGKTNVSVNLADMLGKINKTYLIDYDNVNPYFRAADAAGTFGSSDVTVVSGEFVNTNVDIPSVSPLVYSALCGADNGHSVIFDVGGDMTGAVSLGFLHDKLVALDPVVLYVFSAFRPLTDSPEAAYQILKEIEASSKLAVTALVNNSNIGAYTTAEDIESTAGCAERLCDLSGLPLLFTSYMTDRAPDVKGEILKINNRTKILF